MKNVSEEITNIKHQKLEYPISVKIVQTQPQKIIDFDQIICPTNKIKIYYTNKTWSPTMTPQEQET